MQKFGRSYHTRARLRLATSLLLVVVATLSLHAQTVAVAANAQYLIEDLSSAFHKATGNTIRTVVGSSGVLAAQIRNGAPFDVLLSADTAYPMGLWRDGFADDTPRVYAFGTLILWSRSGLSLKNGLRSVLDRSVRKIAVANPRTAPYGAAAIEALHAGGLYDSVSSKIVFGESVAQVNQYVNTKAAEVGLTASSVVFSGGGRDVREWTAVDRSLYASIPQAAVCLRRGSAATKGEARAFIRFLSSADAKAIFRRFGYALP